MPVSSTRPSAQSAAVPRNQPATAAASHAPLRGVSFHHVLARGFARPVALGAPSALGRQRRAPTAVATAPSRKHAPMEEPDAGKGRSVERDATEGDSSDDDRRRCAVDPGDVLDPAARQAALLAPPPHAVASATAADATEAPRARMSMEELLPALVRRIAWAGDKHRGSVRLEIGAGAYEGTTVVVHSDAGRVRVEVSGAGDLEGLRRTLDARLRRHGLDVESVT